MGHVYPQEWDDWSPEAEWQLQNEGSLYLREDEEDEEY